MFSTFARQAVGVGLAALVLALVLTGLYVTRSGGTDRRCGAAVVRDWASNGRVDRSYPDPCYYDAVDSLPEDLRAYSSAEDDILRALQSSAHGTSK
jgi:hypothetical protein